MPARGGSGCVGFLDDLGWFTLGKGERGNGNQGYGELRDANFGRRMFVGEGTPGL